MRAMAFDYGDKKIGVAVGQTVTQTAQPISVIKNNTSLMFEIDKVVLEWLPNCFVIGEITLADGKLHPLEKPIQNFIKTLNLRYNLPIFRENEALTSFEAKEFRSSLAKNKATDAHAAAILLESWIRNNV